MIGDPPTGLDGLAFVNRLNTADPPRNSMARNLGYRIVEAMEGRVVVTATPGGGHLNPECTVHGGYLAILLDACMGLAVRSTLRQGSGSTTLEFKIAFMRPAMPDEGPIRAEGLVLSRGRRVGTAEGRLFDSRDRLLAHGTTTCLIFDRPDRSPGEVEQTGRSS